MGLRKREILERCIEAPGQLAELEKCYRTVCSASRVAQTLGLQAHPELAHFLLPGGGLDWNIPHMLVTSVVYRCDLTTQYANLPGFIMRDGDENGGGDEGGGDEDNAGDDGDL